jgi:tRNA(Ile)-lysidine synthase
MSQFTVAEIALVSRIVDTITVHKLFYPGATLVVGVSGGADSVALLDLLLRLPGFDLTLVVAHLNHCLRGEESDADEQFCRELAAGYGVRFVTRRVEVRAIAATQRLNLEDAARQERINFFDELRAATGAAAVVLAHHADDQAETVMMRLLRGAGTTGLAGMAYCNRRGYVRPLLDVRRFELESYLSARGCRWREDSSNNDTRYLRNRIRHELLPLLEEYNPAICAQLGSTAVLLRDDDAFLEKQALDEFAAAWQVAAGRVCGDIPRLLLVHPALQRRVLRHAFAQLNGTLDGLTRQHIEAMRKLAAAAAPNARLSLPQGVTAFREYDRLAFVHGTAQSKVSGYQLMILEPGSYQLTDGAWLQVEVCQQAEFSSAADTIFIDPERFPFPWTVRTIQPGDRMVPFGMTGRKKVKDLCIDRKIPVAERKRLPVLFCGAELLWVGGVCTSELCRVSTTSGNLVKVSYIRH